MPDIRTLGKRPFQYQGQDSDRNSGTAICERWASRTLRIPRRLYVGLSDDDKSKIYDILSKFPNIRRDLVQHGYYEKEGATKSPSDVFNKDDTKTSLNEISFLINKLRFIIIKCLNHRSK